MNGKALLTLALWAGFWLLGLALVGGLAAVPAFQIHHARTVDFGGLIAGALAVVVAWALRPRFGAEKRTSFSLPRSGHPALFAFIDGVARDAGSRPPDEVRLVSGVTAYASLERRWFGLQRRRIVGVGLPLFVLLDRDELRAVLTHEFGHHVGGDTALGPWVYRTRRSVALAEESLDDSAFFLDVPFRTYGRWLMRVSGSVSRAQELAADALSAAKCGAGAAARALEKTHRVGALWSAYFGFEVVQTLERGARVPLIDGFRRFTEAPPSAWRPEIQRFIAETDAAPPAPEDTHPSLEERMRALGVPRPRISPVPQLRGCADDFGGEALLEDTWYALATEGSLRPTTWEAIAAEVTLPALAEAFRESALDPQRVPLSRLPELVADPAQLWTSFRRGGFDLLSAAAKRQRGLRLLSDWLAVALVRLGYVAEQEPGLPLRLRRGEEVVDPVEQVEALAAGTVSGSDFVAWADQLMQTAAAAGAEAGQRRSVHGRPEPA